MQARKRGQKRQERKKDKEDKENKKDKKDKEDKKDKTDQKDKEDKGRKGRCARGLMMKIFPCGTPTSWYDTESVERFPNPASRHNHIRQAVSYTHLTLPTKRIV